MPPPPLRFGRVASLLVFLIAVYFYFCRFYFFLFLLLFFFFLFRQKLKWKGEADSIILSGRLFLLFSAARNPNIGGGKRKYSRPKIKLAIAKEKQIYGRHNNITAAYWILPPLRALGSLRSRKIIIMAAGNSLGALFYWPAINIFIVFLFALFILPAIYSAAYFLCRWKIGRLFVLPVYFHSPFNLGKTRRRDKRQVHNPIG